MKIMLLVTSFLGLFFCPTVLLIKLIKWKLSVLPSKCDEWVLFALIHKELAGALFPSFKFFVRSVLYGDGHISSLIEALCKNQDLLVKLVQLVLGDDENQPIPNFKVNEKDKMLQVVGCLTEHGKPLPTGHIKPINPVDYLAILLAFLPDNFPHKVYKKETGEKKEQVGKVKGFDKQAEKEKKKREKTLLHWKLVFRLLLSFLPFFGSPLSPNHLYYGVVSLAFTTRNSRGGSNGSRKKELFDVSNALFWDLWLKYGTDENIKQFLPIFQRWSELRNKGYKQKVLVIVTKFLTCFGYYTGNPTLPSDIMKPVADLVKILFTSFQKKFQESNTELVLTPCKKSGKKGVTCTMGKDTCQFIMNGDGVTITDGPTTGPLSLPSIQGLFSQVLANCQDTNLAKMKQFCEVAEVRIGDVFKASCVQN